jgi:intein/homing endonuclease
MSIFLDPDMAYLVGLIVGRGIIRRIDGHKQLIIDFPFKNLIAEGITKIFNTKDKILLSLDETIDRLGELVGSAPGKQPSQNSVSLIFETTKNTLLWRNLDRILKGKGSFREMTIPKEIFSASEEIKKEFLRGFADVSGGIGKSGAYVNGRHRVYLITLYDNWDLLIKLCLLLQSKPLSIPVQTIDWGHPNIRNGNLKRYNAGSKEFWAKEHQLKVFAEYFESIGFRIIHKNEILKELAEFNRKNWPNAKSILCQPPKKRLKMHRRHPEEDSTKLPSKLRSKHFDTYWQVCLELGCKQFKKEKSLFNKNV